MSDAPASSLRPKLLEFAVCPACLGRLAPLGDDEVVCRHAACRRAYGVIHGRIPNLVEEDAVVLDEEAWRARLEAAGLPARDPDDRRPDRRRPRRRRERPAMTPGGTEAGAADDASDDARDDEGDDLADEATGNAPTAPHDDGARHEAGTRDALHDDAPPGTSPR